MSKLRNAFRLKPRLQTSGTHPAATGMRTTRAVLATSAAPLRGTALATPPPESSSDARSGVMMEAMIVLALVMATLSATSAWASNVRAVCAKDCCKRPTGNSSETIEYKGACCEPLPLSQICANEERTPAMSVTRLLAVPPGQQPTRIRPAAYSGGRP